MAAQKAGIPKWLARSVSETMDQNLRLPLRLFNLFFWGQSTQGVNAVCCSYERKLRHAMTSAFNAPCEVILSCPKPTFRAVGFPMGPFSQGSQRWSPFVSRSNSCSYISLFGGCKHHLLAHERWVSLGGGDVLRANIGSPVQTNWASDRTGRERSFVILESRLSPLR